MLKRLLFAALIVMVFGAASPGVGQPADPEPVLLASMESIESIQSRSLYRLTESGWQLIPIEDFYAGSLSPDGSTFAYLHVPPFLRSLLDDGQDWFYGSAWDLALLNLQDGTVQVIASQPEAIATNSQGYQDGIKRSRPVWSPDGAAIAWTEQDYPAQNIARLVTYTLGDSAPQIRDAALPQMGLSADGMPSFLTWTADGIAVFTNDPSDSAETLRLYDPLTGALQVVRLPRRDQEWIPMFGPFGLTDTQSESAREWVVMNAGPVDWVQVDPISGDVDSVMNQMELVSATDPDSSLRLVWAIYAESDTPAWTLLAADGTPQSGWESAQALNRTSWLRLFALAPSGQAAAWVAAGAVVVWRDGLVTTIATPEGLRITDLYWGAARWQTGLAYDGLG